MPLPIALSCACLPDGRISPGMKDREHHDSLGLNAIKDGIWEAPRLHAPDVTMLDGKAFRLVCGEIDCAIDLGSELYSKTRLPFLVPQCCAVEFGACGAPKDDL